MNYCEPIRKLYSILESAGVPCVIIPCFDGEQIRFPWCYGDVACHRWTEFSKDGKVETYKFPWDEDDISALTIEEAANKIINLYCKNRRLNNVYYN